MKYSVIVLPAAFVLLLFTGAKNSDLPVYLDKSCAVNERVEDLLNKLTLEEKVDLLGGTGFASKEIKRLGIPELRMTDGPQGARWELSNSYPNGISMAATWNPALIQDIGKAIGQDVKAKGRNVILGPCVNILRLPQGGRNFESFGEDSYLTSRITVDYIKGVQQENVAACVKHFAVNNQEHQRTFVDVKVDERALHEIYFPAFKAAVQEADVLTLMCSYNKVNGPYAAENDYLLKDVLKEQWKFDGLVMSDWGAVHSSLPVARGGLDLEMPTGYYLNDSTLMDAIKSGEIAESVINDKVRRLLTVIFKLGLFDKQIEPDSSKIKSEFKSRTAYQAALESIVLLKNDNNTLPLKADKIKSIAVIGPNAAIARTGGGGSGYVDPIYAISPLEGLKKKLGNNVKINFAKGVIIHGDTNPIEPQYIPGGLKAEFYNNMKLEGEPVLTRTDEQVNFNWFQKAAPEVNEDLFSVRWTGKVKAPETGKYFFDITSDDGVRFYFNDKLIINDWTDHSALTNSASVEMAAGQTYHIKLEFYDNGGEAICLMGWRLPGEDLTAEAVEAAKNSDVALVFAGTNKQIESEGFDRPDLELPNGQSDLVAAVAKANKNTIVVLNNGGPVIVNQWLKDVSAVLETWFYGQEGGNAIADVLFGDYNPSGKSPMTWPEKWEDCSAYGTYKSEDSVTYYKDGIYVGYRHFEKNNIKPVFPFGFGLSYTTFDYNNLIIDNSGNIKVKFDVKNTGKVKGEEVVQLYVRDIESSVDRPVKELKRFSKVLLNPGESKTVEFELTKDDLSFYDVKTKSWIAEPGDFEILAGSSSADIKLKDKFTYK
jgi:beta-glucosidase